MIEYINISILRGSGYLSRSISLRSSYHQTAGSFLILYGYTLFSTLRTSECPKTNTILAQVLCIDCFTPFGLPSKVILKGVVRVAWLLQTDLTRPKVDFSSQRAQNGWLTPILKPYEEHETQPSLNSFIHSVTAWT